MKTARVLPFYFGPAAKRLYGCLHQPSHGSRDCAILICQPVGHEYVNSHRALRQLAARFSEAGFPVLRFDYYGCGDSSGDAEEATVPQWLDDISTAISELKHRSGLFRVCLIGLRLGAALSAVAAAGRSDVVSMAFWDPVVRGSSYLQELVALQKEMQRFRPKFGRRNRHDGLELLGFPFPHALASGIGDINLLTIAGHIDASVLVIESRRPEIGSNLQSRLTQPGARVDYQQMDIPQIWLPTVDGSLLVPAPALNSVVSWIGSTQA
jgi:uncharacterized protein